MTATLTLPYNQVSAIPLALTDGVTDLPGAVPKGSAVSSNASLVAASVSTDGTMLTLVPVGQTVGNATITVNSPGLTPWVLEANITAPVPKAVTGDVEGATFAAYVSVSSTAAGAAPTAS